MKTDISQFLELERRINTIADHYRRQGARNCIDKIQLEARCLKVSMGVRPNVSINYDQGFQDGIDFCLKHLNHLLNPNENDAK